MIRNGSIVVSVHTGRICKVLDYSNKGYFEGKVIGEDRTKIYLFRNHTKIGQIVNLLDKASFIPYYKPYKKLKLL